MKRICMCIAVLAMGVLIVGCDGVKNLFKEKTEGHKIAEDDYEAEKAGQREAGTRSQANMAAQETRRLNAQLESRLTNEINKTNRIIEEIRERDALPILRNRLTEIKMERDKLEESAKAYELDSLNALSAMKRHENEEGEQASRYKNLIRDVGTKPENMEQMYQVGSHTLTGERIMAILKDYKDAAFEASKKVADAKKESDYCKQMAQNMRLNWIPCYKELIDNMERTIRDCERLLAFTDRTVGIDSLRVKAKEELDAVQKKVDDMNNRFGIVSPALSY